MNRKQIVDLVGPMLAGRGLDPRWVVNVIFGPVGIEVEYFVRDYQGKIIWNGDDPQIAVSYFRYED